jgi:hypothetical protein
MKFSQFLYNGSQSRTFVVSEDKGEEVMKFAEAISAAAEAHPMGMKAAGVHLKRIGTQLIRGGCAFTDGGTVWDFVCPHFSMEIDIDDHLSTQRLVYLSSMTLLMGAISGNKGATFARMTIEDLTKVDLAGLLKFLDQTAPTVDAFRKTFSV